MSLSAFAHPDHLPDNDTDRQFVVALARGLEILACFSAERPFLTNGELARMTNMACSSVSRLTHTLVKLGHLDYDGDAGRYRLGPSVLSLQPAALAGTRMSELVDIADLAKRVGEKVLVAVYESYGLIVVNSATATPEVPANPIGRRYPIPKSAMGRAYVASCSSHEQERILSHLAHGEERQVDTLRSEMNHAVTTYRSRGYCTSLGILRPGNHSLAVTMNLPSLGRRAILACGGPAQRLSERRLHEQVAPLLMQTATEIERASGQLGFPHSGKRMDVPAKST
jgi:DNA-binding IclR family transcriptional regulator